MLHTAPTRHRPKTIHEIHSLNMGEQWTVNSNGNDKDAASAHSMERTNTTDNIQHTWTQLSTSPYVKNVTVESLCEVERDGFYEVHAPSIFGGLFLWNVLNKWWKMGNQSYLGEFILQASLCVRVFLCAPLCRQTSLICVEISERIKYLLICVHAHKCIR